MSDVGSTESEASRYDRERSFHDDRFGAEEARPSDRFYGVAQDWIDMYASLLAGVGVGSRVLEYGCGTGSSAYDIAARGGEVVGIDISPVAIAQAADEAAARGLTGLTFTEMNAEALDLPDDSFDVVCGSGILHHLDLDTAMSEVQRVLRPGGFAVFGEPLGHNPVINAYRRFTPAERTEDEHPLRQTDLDGFRERFGTVECSFHVLLALAALPLRTTRWFEPARDRATKLDQALFRRVPTARRFAWTVIVQLRDPKPT